MLPDRGRNDLVLDSRNAQGRLSGFPPGTDETGDNNMDTNTYRAAVWTSRDGQRQVVLTLPEHAGISDYDLLSQGLSAADSMGLTRNAIYAPAIVS